MHKNKILACTLLGLMLAACSSDKKPPLKGERISVLQMQNTLAADQSTEDKPIILPEQRANTAWPQAGGNASHMIGNLAFGKATQLKKLWSSSIGDGSDKRSKLITQPVAAFGRVFAANINGEVSAYSLKDGKRLWETEVMPEDSDSATVSPGLGFAVDTLFVTDGINHVLALDPATGKTRWKKRLNTGLRGAPTFNNNRLYVTTIDDQTLALNPMNGETLWSHQGVAENAAFLGSVSPAAQESVVITGYSSGDIVALRAETGQEAWSDNIAGMAEVQSGAVTKLAGFHGFPVIDGEFVVAANSANRLVAIHIPSGERLWQKELGALQTPWVSGNGVYLITPQNELVAVLKEGGQIHWTTQLPKYEDPDDKEDPIFFSGPIMAGDHLWTTSSEGMLMCFDPTNGKELGRTDLPGSSMLAPVVVDGKMIILTDNGQLAVYTP